ncbi:MAG: PEP-CTERM sorting domain-containing protein [Planctomycetales bacterium]|nr:PEP-CTERM sorting domain-containing protein [Planctomycetales bacterium]
MSALRAFANAEFSVAAVPEPSSFGLLGASSLGLLYLRRRRKSTKTDSNRQ